jgi:hypothetical protein
MTLDIKNLTRFPILDMKEELINNGVGEIEGYRTNIIVQRIYPRHLREFYLQESEYVVYLSKKDIDRYVENCKK